jgi:lipooligosaccharide transport system ATP-binding protein
VNKSGLDPIIQANNLTKRFGDFLAVDGISFAIFPGECFGFLGPNGAGKTSTIRMIYGFSPLGSGSLNVFGRDIHRDLREIKYKIGVCQQDNNLDPDLSVWDNLLVFARYFDLNRKVARERAEELLEFFGLSQKKEARIPELSGGMLRRLVVARALINQPTLLILDEPTTGLDPQSRHQLWEKLRQLKAQGLCILLTTHYMDEAAQMCDRLMIMDHGRILVEGAPRTLVRQYIGGNVIEVEEPGEELPDFLKREGISYEVESNRLLIYTADGEALFRRISQQYCAAGCTLRQATLEDVFLKLTGRGLRE